MSHLPAQSIVDAVLPPEMAQLAEEVGVRKASLPLAQMFTLAVLAGAFIALGGVFATTVTAGAAGSLPFGVTRLLGGLVFSLGLILVIVAGAELFTGNNLIVMALASGKLTLRQLLRNWCIVYAGNFVGALATALMMLLTCQYQQGGGIVGQQILATAATKCELGFVQAITLGMLCNALVCLAVWLCYSARTTTDKILSIIFPITAFVAAGFEHSVANMYFIPMGLLVRWTAAEPFWTSVSLTPADFDDLTIANFLIANLLPVTIGNIIGGSVMVGMVYWFVYLRSEK